MRQYSVPNMSALLAFEAAARHESFTHAAKELSLTESAVSRQIATLEARIGIQLFVRAKQRVILTRAGRLYSAQVRSVLEALNRDTLSIIAHGSGGGFLELAVLPTFASQWLIPRIKAFNDAHPDVRVNMGVRTGSFSFGDSHFEAAIHYGEPTWPGTTADYLFGEEVVPICAPSLLKDPIASAEELLNYPLLHSTTRPDAWTQWFSNLGVEDSASMRGVRYELHSMLIAAATAGLGIALVPRFFVENRLEKLGLTVPFAATLSVGAAYYLVYPPELSHGKPLAEFRRWLSAEAAAFHEATESGVGDTIQDVASAVD
jgi:LysR family transcriptional regulator, glycine cleavage system transcriptional activator